MFIASFTDAVRRAASAVADGAVADGAVGIIRQVYENLPSINQVATQILGTGEQAAAQPIAIVHVTVVPTADELAQRRERMREAQTRLQVLMAVSGQLFHKLQGLRSELLKKKQLKIQLPKLDRPADLKEVVRNKLETEIPQLEAQIIEATAQSEKVSALIIAISGEINAGVKGA